MSQAFFQVITLFPELIEAFASSGVVSQAVKKNILEIKTINPRQFTTDVHQSVDDRPFGGGDGMIMLAEPLGLSIELALKNRPSAKVYYLSPQGTPLSDTKVKALAQSPDLILLCGRYAGIDQRVLQKYEVEEISVGDYVISGGELAAAIVIDAVARFVPGVLGHVDSAEKDSFKDGLLEAPLFTRPRELWGLSAPEILFSGHHAKIQDWQKKIAILNTLRKRPDLRPLQSLSGKELKDLKSFYAALSEEEKKQMSLTDLQIGESNG